MREREILAGEAQMSGRCPDGETLDFSLVWTADDAGCPDGAALAATGCVADQTDCEARPRRRAAVTLFGCAEVRS